MAIPKSTESFLDGGVGFTEPSSMTCIVIGQSAGGTLAANTLAFYNSGDTLRTEHGEGHGVLAVDNILTKSGGPVGYVRATTSVAGATTAVVNSGGGPTVTLAGTPVHDSSLKITITKAGALGVAQFTYTLDGVTTTEVLVVPAGGTYVLTKAGITVTFAAGTYVLGATYTSTFTAPCLNVSDLNTAFAAVAATQTPWRFVYVVTSDGVTSAASALLSAALQAQLDTLASGSSRYRRGIVSACGVSAAETLTTYSAAAAAPRVLISYGKVRRSNSKSYPGYAVPITQNSDCFAARAAASLISTDLKRVKSGNLTEVVTNYHDEYTSPSGLDDIKISTLRTYGNADVYVCQGRLRSTAGSDYRLWPHGIVMDVVAEAVHRVLQTQIGRGLRTYTNTVADVPYTGVLDPRDAGPIEKEVNDELANLVGTPINAEGNAGHVAAYRYTISQTHNFLQTGIIVGTLRAVPLGYVEGTDTQLGFVVEIVD